MNSTTQTARSTRFARRALAAAITVQCTLAADSSSVTIDWSARTTGQEACVAAGSTGSTPASLVISNANVILYTYALNVKSYQLPSNDAPTSILAASGIAAESAEDPESVCREYAKEASEVWADSGLFPKNAQSVALSQTLAALNSRSSEIKDLVNNQGSLVGAQSLCRRYMTAGAARRVAMIVSMLQEYQEKQAALEKNSDLSTISFPYQIDTTHYYVFTLQEQTRYDHKLTNATLHWKCGIDDTLTLSLGVMGTTLPYRTYTSQSIPSGSSTQNVLAVSGASGWTPQGLALLNYKLFTVDNWALPGLTISTGPVFKFGSTPQVSNFGWFAGLSVSFWRRLFITPGLHLGQFADFPLGFTSGTQIPANFGQLNPVTRWSGRFGLGITFQTNSFGKSNSSTPTSTTTPTTVK